MGGGALTYAIDADHVLIKGEEMSADVVDPSVGKSGYIYGITGGIAYVDSTTTQYDAWEDTTKTVAGGLKGTVETVNGIISIFSGIAGLDQSLIDAVGDVNTVLQKTESANSQTDTIINEDTGLHLENYGYDWVRYYGAVGGDVSVNTGIQGSTKLIIGTGSGTELLKTSDNTSIVRHGNINNTINSGSVIGGVGGSAAAALGNMETYVDYTKKGNGGIFSPDVTIQADIKFNGKTSTTINGNVNTIADPNTNIIGWTNGGTAIGLGGTAESTINGATVLTIDGTDRAAHEGSYETPGANDILPQLTTALNVMKGSKINAIGVTGGGTAMTTLGGTAESNVNGTTTINVENATVLGAIGGGIAASVDATGIAEQVYKPGGTELQLGNDAGYVDVTGSQLEGILGTNIPDSLKITAIDAVNGGTAQTTTGDTNIALTGNSTAVGVMGGGAAVASHTYTWKADGTNREEQGYTVNDEYGKSVAKATTGKSHITVNLDSKLNSWDDKKAMLGDVQSLTNKIVTDTGDIQADELKDLANKGAAIGIFGGGAAIAHSGNRQFVDEENKEQELSQTDGAFATATTAGADIQLAGGYIAGVMGGGAAGAINNSTATAEMTDTVDITIGGYVDEEGNPLEAEAVGVFGNGLAYYTGTSNGGQNALKGQAVVTAKDANINVYGGSVDGIIGGGMAIDDSQADYTNAKAISDGTAAIHVAGGNVNKVDAFAALTGLFGQVDTTAAPDISAYADGVKAAAGDAAIAAGGIALGGGAEAYVKEGEVNISGGTVNGDIYGGGIAAYGYAESDGEAKGSRVDTTTINLTGGKVDGNIYAGGAAATETSSGSDVYGAYNQAKATVGTATVNLAGTDVTGILYGKGTVNQQVVEDSDPGAEQAAVKHSTLNLIGENTLSNIVDGQAVSKIQAFDNVNVTANSMTKLDNSIKPGTAALIDGGTVTVDSTARLDISALAKTGSPAYNIAANYNDGSTFWSDDNLIYDRMAAYATSNATAGGNGSLYTITYDTINETNWQDAAESMGSALEAGPIQPLVDQGMRLGWNTNKGISEGAREYFSDWMYNPSMNAAFGRGMMIGEDSAVTGNTVSVARDVADEISQHLSFTEDFIQDHDSIYGDSNIWAKYIHNKFETDGMSSSFGGITADNDYNGVIVGVDFAQHGKLQSGAAIHYGNGDGTGRFTNNDYDAWGVTLYGALKDEEAGTNLMADIGYTKTSNDITGSLNGKDLTADRDLTAWTIGVRGEKEFVSGRNQIVPYVGLRYMNVDPSSYTAYYDGKKAFDYDADKQDIWMVPVGVSLRNETKTGNGWRITPKLDVAYIWAFGDTDNEVDVNMAGASAPLYYTVMDDGSWLASLGVDASHGAWTFGAGYAYQKGDDTKNNKWYVNAGFAF